VTNATGDYVIVGCSANRLSNKNDAENTRHLKHNFMYMYRAGYRGARALGPYMYQ
jgi:hypothetical protein